jgi:serine/threonine protein kinase
MPSDSIAGFFDRAKASRVLFPEQVEQLFLQPDLPHANLDSLCEYLEERGAITRFQSEAIRSGRGEDLSFASYPVIDELGACPGGVAFRALHPSLRTPIELRRFRAASLEPTDTPSDILHRAKTAASIHHPNLVTLLDAGQSGEEAFAAIDPPTDSSPLDVLVKEIGAMPAFLAAEYGRQIAGALRAAHERGLAHGDIRPANVHVGPMTTKTNPDGSMKRRPAPNAAAKLAELGLVPVRGPGAQTPPPDDALPYLPPERLDVGTHDPRGDLYSLGATLYFLLTGRPPFTGTQTSELLVKVRAVDPAPLASLRPDVPPAFAEFVHKLLKKNPAERPSTAFDVEEKLVSFCRPGVSPPPSSGPVPMAVAHVEDDAEVPAAESHPSTADEWGAANAFSTSHASAEPRPKRMLTAKDKSRTRMLIILGLTLHLCATAFLIALCAGAFNSSPEPEPVPTKDKAPKKKPNPRT